MITQQNKIKLIFITACIDLILFHIYWNQKLTKTDEIYVQSIFLIHFLLYISLWFSFYKLIDILHVCLFLSILCFFFIDSFQIQVLLLGLMFTIQLLWMWEDNQCIMNTKGNVFHGVGGKIFHTLKFSYFTLSCIYLGKKLKVD